MDFLKKLACMPFVKALLLKALRHGLTAGGTLFVGWLGTKGADPTRAGELVQYLIGAGMTAAGIALSMMDANNVDNRLKASSAVGAVVSADAAKQIIQSGVVAQLKADQSHADKVAAAVAAADRASPKTKAALLDALTAGAS